MLAKYKYLLFALLAFLSLCLLPGCDVMDLAVASVITDWLPLIFPSVTPQPLSATVASTTLPTVNGIEPTVPSQTKPSTPTLAFTPSHTPTNQATPAASHTATVTPTLTITHTKTAMPSKTPTMTATFSSILEIELQNFVNWPGDLPEGYSHGKIPHYLPDMFEECPMPHNAIFQEFLYKAQPAGGITIMLYSSVNNANAAYEQLLQDMITAQTLPGSVGERSRMTAVNLGHYQPGSTLIFVDYLFQSCRMVVHIRWTDTLNLSAVETYARRIDERLSPIVCQLP